MQKLGSLMSGNGLVVGAATAVSVAAIATGAYMWSGQPAPLPSTQTTASAVQPPQDQPEAAPAPAPTAQTQEAEATPDAPAPEAVATALPDAPQTATPPDLASTPTPPTIDEVRLSDGGIFVVAGRAAPGSTVSVRLDGLENTSAAVNGGGAFAAVSVVMPSPDARVLTIVQRDADGTEVPGAEEVILAPVPQPKPEAVVSREAEDNPEPAAAPAPTDLAKAPTSEQAEDPSVAPVETDDNTQTADVKIEEAPATPAPATSEVAQAAPQPQPTPQASEIAKTPPQPSDTAEATPQPSKPAEAATPEATEDVASVAPAAPLQDTPAPAVPTPAPAPAAPSQVAEAAPPAEAPLPQADAAAPAPAAPQAEAAAPVPEVSDAPQRVAVLRSGPEGVRLVNPGAGPEVMDNVALDTISYSEAGAVQLAGRAQSDADAVRVYLDNTAIAVLPVDEAGQWRGDLPNVDTGLYTLRIDEVDAQGDVSSRVETPFRREDPAVLASARTSDAPAAAITVQSGATLWAIARERYGEGILYVRVFEANRDAIADPDLIYPGQVFALPSD